MTYDLEAINTLFAQVAECMHHNPARAMRLLGQAKAKVQTTLERATNGHGVRLAAECSDHESDYPPEIWRDDDRQQRGGDVGVCVVNCADHYSVEFMSGGVIRKFPPEDYAFASYFAQGYRAAISAQQRQDANAIDRALDEARTVERRYAAQQRQGAATTNGGEA